MNHKIIVITGPTASGKTSLAIKQARIFDGVIINGDSVAVYRGMDIGTAKPAGKEMQKVPHFLFDTRNPDEEYNAAMYVADVKKILSKIPENKPVFIVGGSMLYIDAFVYNYEFDARKSAKSPKHENILYLAMDIPREKLYRNINKRFDLMMSEGFLSEVQSLYSKYGNTKSLNAAGYRQLIQYLNGKLVLDQAVEKAKQAHRNFAKRQMTWFRHNPDIIWIKNSKEAEKITSEFL
jgi:tRNA dimethylallyltransferase